MTRTYEVPPRLKAWLETYRTWDQADTDLEKELTACVDAAETCSAELDVLAQVVADAHLEAFHEIDTDKHNDVDQVERALRLLAMVKKALDLNQRVALYDQEGLAEFRQLLQRYDELDVFRSRVLGVVRQAGAVDIKAFPDDNRLVILLQHLMP